MQPVKQMIQNYGLDVDDFETSPFEAIEMLHNRSAIQARLTELNDDDRETLRQHDETLYRNATRMYQHIAHVYDFDRSTKPLTEWWWHLDKVAVNYEKKPASTTE
ncbi:hypothetical protein [Paenibacillus soyae]|uniref:Uncharacterized protein n=1 Tax=Paenibacillus soyae TaxID=2969249 RepID=A0A9X2MNP5_9BACL|nr:hypothetical protein [Paenibacillus soyae]MCR2805318.1 hypothetical protein [Paenibacillus soyae]